MAENDYKAFMKKKVEVTTAARDTHGKSNKTLEGKFVDETNEHVMLESITKKLINNEARDVKQIIQINSFRISPARLCYTPHCNSRRLKTATLSSHQK